MSNVESLKKLSSAYKLYLEDSEDNFKWSKSRYPKEKTKENN